MPLAAMPDRVRVDAFDKVKGATRYAADFQFANMLHAMLAPSRIAKGMVTGVDASAALRVPGVVGVLTAKDFPPPPESDQPPPPTLIDQIGYRGQPVALVVAESLEAAVEGVEELIVGYRETGFSCVMEDEGATREAEEPLAAGDAAAALAGAAVFVDQTYECPTQHHNPIEMLATTAVVEGGRLTLYECSQHVMGVKLAVAGSLGLDPTTIDVKSAYIGGGFGQKGSPYGYSAIVARAAVLTGRPVKLVIPRGQIFHFASYRPKSRHHIRLGADRGGRMLGVEYAAEHENSQQGYFSPRDYHEATGRLYDIPNYNGTGTHIRLDRNDAGYMRCPYPHQACFAFEFAVDELAYELGQDPVALRLMNTGERMNPRPKDPLTGKPHSSRYLNACITEGARRFGWSRRTAAPGSMRMEDGTLVGWGMAVGNYPSPMAPSIATLRVGADGRSRFAVSGHEMGQGIRTSIANVLIDGLGLNLERLEIMIGDTTVAPQHMTAGSWGSAGCVPTAAKAVTRMQASLRELLAGREVRGDIHRQLALVKRPYLEVQVSETKPGADAQELTKLREAGDASPAPEYRDFVSMSHIAHFVEVRVEPTTCRVRIPRVVSIADCGRVISPRTALSQMHGGIVWAFGAALREATEIDPRYGGYLNSDLADYVVPVNADIGEIDAGFVDEPDPMQNSVGLKGLGEVVMAGAAPAIANAIFHATGKRLRSMPFRIEDLL